MPDIAALTAAVARAEDEVFRITMADGFAFTNGAYDRAMSVLLNARRALNEALLQQIEAQGAAIVAASRNIVQTLNGELA